MLAKRVSVMSGSWGGCAGQQDEGEVVCRAMVPVAAGRRPDAATLLVFAPPAARGGGILVGPPEALVVVTDADRVTGHVSLLRRSADGRRGRGRGLRVALRRGCRGRPGRACARPRDRDPARRGRLAHQAGRWPV